MADKKSSNNSDMPNLTSPGGLVSSGGFMDTSINNDQSISNRSIPIRKSEAIANFFGGLTGSAAASKKKDARPINEVIDTGE